MTCVDRMTTHRDRIDSQENRANATNGRAAVGNVALIGALLLGTLASCATDRPSQAQRPASPTRSVTVASSSIPAPPASTLPPSPGAAVTPPASVVTKDQSGDVTPASVDVVLCRHVLWALPDRDAVLATWARLLRPGGRLVFVEGSWGTGVRLPADDCKELVLRHRGEADVRQLGPDPALWGRWVDDERYLLLSTR